MSLRRTPPMVMDICRNVRLHRTQSTHVINKKMFLEQCNEDQTNPCVVLFPWLSAKPKVYMKYVNCWTSRGYNVLLVQTSVKDLLCPKTGSTVTASTLLDYLQTKEKESLLMHCLSVGGYLTQKLLMIAPDSFNDRISHIIYDSFTNVEGLEAGVLEVAPPTFKGVISTIIRKYTQMADLSSFNDARKFAMSSSATTPTCFMHSMADRVAPYTQVKPIIDARKTYCPVEMMLLPAHHKVAHVSILKHLGEKAYMDYIGKFIAKY